MKNKFVLTCIAALTICSSAASFANSVNFSASQTSGAFNCKVTPDSSLIPPLISIKTDSVEILGLCAGQPHVTRGGFATGFKVDEINNSHFAIHKSIGNTGTANVVVIGGTVECSEGTAGRPQYGQGGYC